MITPTFKRIIPGHPSGPSAFDRQRVITARSLNKPRQQLEELGRIRGDGTINVVQTPGGPQVTIGLPPVMYIRLTGDPAGDGGYPWQQVVRDFQVGFIPNGVTGNNIQGEPNYAPAYESQTGDTTLTADGTVYEATQSQTSGEWLFDGKN